MSKFRIVLLASLMGVLGGCLGPLVAGDSVSPIEPEAEVLTQARDAGFDYIGSLRRAERGEIAATVALINFSIHTDAAGALAHGWVLLELQKMIGKGKFSDALAAAKSDGRKSALESMEVAATYE
jgi:hypothetical protein